MNSIHCLVCGAGLEVRSATGRKSGKPFLMLICPVNGRHFRAFITDQKYVSQIVEVTQRARCFKATGTDRGLGTPPEGQSVVKTQRENRGRCDATP
jgi:hypothetical protein